MKEKMEKHEKQWRKMIESGNQALANDDCNKAIQWYEQALAKAERLINEAALSFQGNTNMLGWYSCACHGLVSAYQHSGKPESAQECLGKSIQKVLSILKNPNFPFLLRGKAIRECEHLFDITVEFYQSIGKPMASYIMIQQTLTEIHQHIAHMLPLKEIARRN
jgi:tetratricopeptide (TPR) repeat protein